MIDNTLSIYTLHNSFPSSLLHKPTILPSFVHTARDLSSRQLNRYSRPATSTIGDGPLKNIVNAFREEGRRRKKEKKAFFERARARRDRFYVLETFVRNALTLHAPIDMSSAVFYLFVLKLVWMMLRAYQAFSVSRRWDIFKGMSAAQKRTWKGNERALPAAPVGLFKETIIKVALIKRVVT